MSCLAEQKRGQKAAGGAQNPRKAAARLVTLMLQGRSLSDLFAHEMGGVEERDRSFVKEVCFGVARWYPRLHALLGLLLEKPLKARDREIEALLLVGAYQLLFMRTPAHAAVKETVDAARQRKRPWATGFVNGVLRRFQREQEQLLGRLQDDPSAAQSMPGWLLRRMQENWPDRWQSVCAAASSHPPMSLRVNLARQQRGSYVTALLKQGATARPIPGVPGGVVLDRPMDVSKLPGFAEGWVSVQDGGAQLAAPLLDLAPGQRVLDACAAPGGKSCHILEMEPGVELHAMDVDADRLSRVDENLRRLQQQAHLHLGDAANPQGDWANLTYDRILLDVPCSATGVIRRHPDIKVLRKAGDIVPLVELQGRIMDAVWPLLKPGGMLLYATCSLLPEENEQQVIRFLDRQQDARERKIDAIWGHPREVGRQTLPGEATMDGFFYACLEKLRAKK